MPDNFSFDETDDKVTLGGGSNLKKILIWVIPAVVIIVAVYLIFFSGGRMYLLQLEVPIWVTQLTSCIDSLQKSAYCCVSKKRVHTMLA